MIALNAYTHCSHLDDDSCDKRETVLICAKANNKRFWPTLLPASYCVNVTNNALLPTFHALTALTWMVAAATEKKTVSCDRVETGMDLTHHCYFTLKLTPVAKL